MIEFQYEQLNGTKIDKLHNSSDSSCFTNFFWKQFKKILGRNLFQTV